MSASIPNRCRGCLLNLLRRVAQRRRSPVHKVLRRSMGPPQRPGKRHPPRLDRHRNDQPVQGTFPRTLQTSPRTHPRRPLGEPRRPRRNRRIPSIKRLRLRNRNLHTSRRRLLRLVNHPYTSFPAKSETQRATPPVAAVRERSGRGCEGSKAGLRRMMDSPSRKAPDLRLPLNTNRQPPPSCSSFKIIFVMVPIKTRAKPVLHTGTTISRHAGIHNHLR